MCFSAETSFTASAVISVIGAATLAKVKRPAHIPFGVIPLIFGLQQCAEGVLWVTLKSGIHERLQTSGMYVFLITALIIWPTMIPLSVWLLEKSENRRKIFYGLTAAGAIVSLFYACCLLFFSVTPQIQGSHISYGGNFPEIPVKIAIALYLVATIAPFFVSSVRRMWLFGVLIAVSCLAAGIFFFQYVTSTWCFFAACISIVIYWIVRGLERKASQTPNIPQG